MNPRHLSRFTAVAPLCVAALLAACASQTPAPEPAPTPAPAAVVVAPAPTPAPAPAPVYVAPAPAPAPVTTAPVVSGKSTGAPALNEGVAAFQKGEYRRAETKLAESQKLGLKYVDEIVLAHKTQAFLYCVTKRTAQCEKSFQSAFEMDSGFDLARAERGHPVWGPVFAKVKKKQPK
jgi:hypothetical protein